MSSPRQSSPTRHCPPLFITAPASSQGKTTVTDENLDRIINEHSVNGVPVEDLIYHRS